MTPAPARVVRFALCLAAALAAAACDAGSHRAHVPDALVAPAAWEASFAEDERTAELRGRVVETDEPALLRPGGTPSAGARVELLIPAPDGRPPYTPAGEVTTGPDGVWSFAGAPRTAWVVRASKDGRLPTVLGRQARRRGVLEAPVAPEIELTLHPARDLPGRVTDRQGRPVSGVAVEADAPGWFDTATTGADGTFLLRAPHDALAVSLQDGAWQATRQRVDPGAAFVNVSTVATPHLPGSVASLEDGRPIAGARVWSLAYPDRRAVTGDDGRFDLDVPRWGRVAIFADGFGWLVVEVPRAADLQVRLRPSSPVAGRVVDAAGRPAEEARIVCVARHDGGVRERVTGPLTDADGSFRFTWRPRLDPGFRSFALAWHRRLGISDPVALPWTGEPELRLCAWRSAAGVVTDADGKPVRGAVVSVAWRLAGLDDEEAMMTGVPLERSAATGDDGRFAVPDVPTGRELTLTADVYGLRLTKTLAAEGDASSVRFELPRGRRLGGRVADRRGAPVPGAMVIARLLDVPGASYERTVFAGDDATFAIDDAPAGRYSLEARADGFDVPAAAVLEAAQSEAALVLGRNATLSVRLAPPAAGAAEPPPDAQFVVRVRDLDMPDLPPHRHRFTAAQLSQPCPVGKFRAGRWGIEIDGDDWRGVGGPVELGDGEVRTEAVVLRPASRLRGVVRSSAGKLVPQAPLLLVPLDSDAWRPPPRREGDPPSPPLPADAPRPVSVNAGEDGRFEISGLLAGRWQVRATPRDHAELVTEVTLPAPAPLELTLPPCGEVRVAVRSRADAPVDGAIVRLEDASGRPLSAWSADAPQLTSRFRAGKDGVAVLRGVPAGTVRVAAEAPGLSLGPATVTVRDGETSEATLR